MQDNVNSSHALKCGTSRSVLRNPASLEASSISRLRSPLLMLLTHTRRCISELLALTVRDVDFNERCLWTNIEKRRKAQRRKMFLNDITLAELRSYIKDHHLTNSDKLFKRCVRSYQRLPMRYAAKAGIDKYFTVTHSGTASSHT